MPAHRKPTAMRAVIYNIAYGTGAPPASSLGRLWTAHRYLRTSQIHLERVIGFIEHCAPDIVGLVEVDTGSYRTGHLNQVEIIAGHLQHHYCSSVKYGRRSLGRALPWFRHQSNAVLTKGAIPANRFHFFPLGFKRLIIEVEMPGFRFFLVHLALQQGVRRQQLAHLAELAAGNGPVIIAGDFNCFRGEDETADLQRRLDLVNPNRQGMPTWPSWNPRRQLDAMLCSRGIRIHDFRIPDVRYSDHLPVILDFEA
jgi:endonuclease/exonuclease/phosphatase family metal-dependent hydrolase